MIPGTEKLILKSQIIMGSHVARRGNYGSNSSLGSARIGEMIADREAHQA